MEKSAIKQQFEQLQHQQTAGAKPDLRAVQAYAAAVKQVGGSRSVEADFEGSDGPDGPQGNPPSPAAPGARRPTVATRTIAVAHQLDVALSTIPAMLAAANDEKAANVINLAGGGQQKLTVVIVGGGPACFSALEALMQAPQALLNLLSVFIIDDAPRDQLGRGSAFRRAPGIASDFLYMNMTTQSVQMNKLTRVIQGWLTELGTVTMTDFMLRCDVGEALGRRASQILQDATRVGLPVAVVQGRALDIRLGHEGTVHVDARQTDGLRTVITAHAVIMTIGNENSSRYEMLRGPGFIDAPWSPTAGIHLVPSDATVAIAGSSLSGMDVASVFAAQGHRGPIHMFSPQGRLPGIRPLHASTELKVLALDRLPEVLSGEDLPLSLGAVLRLVERELHAHNLSWEPLQQRLQDYQTMEPLDFLIRESRFTSQVNVMWGAQKAFDDVIAPLWQVMSKEARDFVLKHLGTFAALQWSAAPPTGHRIMEMLHARHLTLHRASSARRNVNDRFVVACKDGSTFESDVFVDASGFAGLLSEFRDPLIQAMRVRGLLVPDETGFGAKARFEDGQLLNADGSPTGPIWAGACALTRGTYLLSNELGEATHSAVRSAHSVMSYLSSVVQQARYQS